MKVGLVMFYDEPIKNFGELNYNINKLYCQKYNFEIIVSNQKKYTDRHSAWERLPLILEHISNYDYLIWIDADAFFYYDSSNIIDIIHNNSDVNFIFSNDVGNQNINTGFFIVKNTEYSIQFLNRWAYDDDFYKHNPYPAWWDQGVLIDMYNKNILDIQQNSIHYDYGFFQHFYDYDKLNNTYIYHLAGTNYNNRYQKSKAYYDKLVQSNLLS